MIISADKLLEISKRLDGAKVEILIGGNNDTIFRATTLFKCYEKRFPNVLLRDAKSDTVWDEFTNKALRQFYKGRS